MKFPMKAPMKASKKDVPTLSSSSDSDSYSDTDSSDGAEEAEEEEGEEGEDAAEPPPSPPLTRAKQVKPAGEKNKLWVCARCTTQNDMNVKKCAGGVIETASLSS